jgi:zinc protease
MVEHVYVTAAAGRAPARSAVDFFQHYPAGANAQTGDRYTAVSTVFAADQLDAELNEAAARMADLAITDADLDRERPRLLDEVANMFERIVPLAALNNAREMVRPTPRGGRRGGLPEQVQALTVDQVRDHWKHYYKPRNAILAAAGAIDPAQFRQAVTNHFERVPGGEPAPSPARPGTALLSRSREIASAPLQPGSTATACVALAPAEPSSELYAPYLVLAARLAKASAARGEGPAPVSIHMPLLDDPGILAITAASRPGESVKQAGERLAARLDEVIEPGPAADEVPMVEQMFGFLLGTVELPDQVLAANP